MASFGTSENQPQHTLREETRQLIAQMARQGVRQLADLPHLKNYGIVRPNRDRLGYGRHFVHVIASTTIAPESYDALQIDGLRGVSLKRVYTERDILRLRAFGHTICQLPDTPLMRRVGVDLSMKQESGGTVSREGGWAYGGAFTISTRGETFTTVHRGPHPALGLAVAGLIARTVQQAHYVDMGEGAATELYAAWLEADEHTPQPKAGQPIWSVFDRRELA